MVAALCILRSGEGANCNEGPSRTAEVEPQLSICEAALRYGIRSLMLTEYWTILRVVFDVCGIVGCALALRCALKHGYRVHI